MTENTNENELLRVVGQWHAIAAKLSFPPCTGPAEVLRAIDAQRKVAAGLAEAAERLLAAVEDYPRRSRASILAGAEPLRLALEAYRRSAADAPPVQPLKPLDERQVRAMFSAKDAVAEREIERRRRIAQALADEHAATLAASAKLDAQIRRLETRHPSLTDAVLFAAVERRMTSLDNPGFCVVCGAESNACEADGEGYECEACGGESTVSSPELLLGII